MKIKNFSFSFFRRFIEKPEGISNQEYRFFILSNYFYFIFLVIHFYFIFLFGYLRVDTLALFNIGSVLIYIVIIYQNYKGRFIIAFFIAAAEVLVHALLGSYFIGDIGLRHALLFLLMLWFVFPIKLDLFKISIGLLICLFYVFLNYYDRSFSPVHTLPTILFNGLGASVSFLAAFIACFLAHYFHTAASKTENVLEKEYERSEELNQLKNRFLGIAAHDLRNPLVSIRGFSEMLLTGDMGPLSEDQIEFLEMINTASQQMLDLVNDLLDVSVIESGMLTLRPALGSLKDLLEERLKIMKMVCEKKDITIHADYQNVQDSDFDRNRIGQVIDNLIGNAVKFSPPGSNIHVTLTVERKNAKVEIRDQGPGLSEEDQSKLFGTFQKLSAAPTAGEKSSGLGLSIVKKIIEAHKGSIKVRSQIGSGSTFTFRIPLESKIE